jgi:ABC-type Fe3+-hydroxamate transport system substrate-binding protein
MLFTDQMERPVALLNHPPKRIISLVPSQTELLHALGLDAEVVGITKFCVHPRTWFDAKTRVGGTKTLNMERIAALEPDLIIGNKEENERTQIEHLSMQYPVWMSDVYTLADALNMIGQVGELCCRPDAAAGLIGQVRAAFDALPAVQPLRAAYLIWRKPYMAAGGHTFIQDMLVRAGFSNVFADKSRYPEVSAADLAASGAQAILLSSEPFPFSDKHIAEIQEICHDAHIAVVNGEMFSWYGSRLALAPVYFEQIRKRLAQIEQSGKKSDAPGKP